MKGEIKDTVKVGDKIYDEYGEARIMAVAEGYVMARRPRCMPFIVALKDIGKNLHPPHNQKMHLTRLHALMVPS